MELNLKIRIMIINNNNSKGKNMAYTCKWYATENKGLAQKAFSLFEEEN